MSGMAGSGPEPAAAGNQDRTTAKTPGWTRRALSVLALRLRHEVALTRALHGDGRTEGFMGLLLSADDAEAILAEASGRLRASGTAVSAAGLEQLGAELAAQRRSDRTDPLCALASALGLDDAELDLLLLAAAPALDARYGLVYGYLNDDVTRRHLTPDLAARLMASDEADLARVRELLADSAALQSNGCLDIAAQLPWVQAAIRLDEHLLDRLLGVSSAAALDRHGTRIRLPSRTGHGPDGRWLLDDGADPAAAGALAVDLADWLGRGLYLLDPATLPLDPGARDLATALCAIAREARLEGLLPVLRGLEILPATALRRLSAMLPPPLVLLTAQPAVWEDAGFLADQPPAGTADRAAAVRRVLDGHQAGTPALQAWLSGLQRLDPLLLARLAGVHREPEVLRRALRGRLASVLSRLAEPVPTTDTLRDLVLPASATAALGELVDRHATGPLVLEHWQLGRIYGRRAGTSALFKGPSGTGKTMAAGAVANQLQLPLFRVNLAGLVSKYIGETEKNLDRLFEAAAGTDVVLFFDEADAIFGKRSEVRDAHDRYANLETAYLLQRLETFSGVAILASNLHQNIDDAFLRRLDAVIEFPAPTSQARRLIWGRLEQGGAILADDVDLDLLAERFELTGGEIRNAALAAAHLAAADGGIIGMPQLMRGIGRELAKAGRPIRRSDFGDHYHLLRTTQEPS